MKIDLNNCKPGQKLLSKHGVILTYVGKEANSVFPHRVRYPEGGIGSRTDDGFVYRNKRLPEDHDIVKILPMLPSTTKPGRSKYVGKAVRIQGESSWKGSVGIVLRFNRSNRAFSVIIDGIPIGFARKELELLEK